MFSTAKTLVKAPSAAKKAAKEQVQMTGLADLAKLNALIEAASTLKSTLETEIKTAGFDKFMELKSKTPRPTSFEGLDGVASASVEMRKRGTNSALNADELEILSKFKIEAFEQEITPELFAINPAYAHDKALLGKVEKALMKIPGLPEDFIVQQAKVSKKVVSEEMLENAFKLADAEQVIQIMTTMALKTKLNETYNMDNLLADAMVIMQPKKSAAVAKLPVAKKKA